MGGDKTEMIKYLNPIKIKAPVFRYSALLLICYALAGCSTVAQKQYKTLTTDIAALFKEHQICLGNIEKLPEYTVLKQHIPHDIRQVTIKQLTNNKKANKQEIKAIHELFPYYQKCRNTLSTQMYRTEPKYVPVLKSTWGKLDDIDLQLINRKMSWGEAATLIKKMSTDIEHNMQVVSQKIAQRFYQADQLERQRAAVAMQQLSKSLNASVKRLKASIPKVKEPTYTDCHTYGSSTNCVTY